MLDSIVYSAEWTSVGSHFTFYFFGLLAGALGAGAAFDLLRARRQSSKPKDAPMLFMAAYRDENGMPIFFEAGEDPSERSAQRVLAQQRRKARGV